MGDGRVLGCLWVGIEFRVVIVCVLGVMGEFEL